MRTTLISALTLPLVLASLSACDLAPEPGEDADRTHDSLEAPEALVAALNGECDDSDPDCAEALDRLDDLALDDDDDGQALLAGSCPAGATCSALSLFEGSTSTTSHLLSLADNTGATNYVNTPPDNSNNLWIMGDWNGDGVDSPGYYSGGKFRYTDVSSAPTNDWSQQLSLVQQPDLPAVAGVVAGRFLADYPNDCIGIVFDDDPSDAETFHLEYWCSLAPSPVDKSHGTQWIGAVLPDSSRPLGTHEFVAGDWDGNDGGLDEIAVRKDQFITYTFIEPDAGAVATFPQAQRWGVPPGELEETGVFVSGDWDGDGTDGWGVLYDDNHFFYRNDLQWNPGADAYYLQHVANLFNSRSVSSHLVL